MAKLIDMFNQFRQWCSWPKFQKLLGSLSYIGGMISMLIISYSAHQFTLFSIQLVITFVLGAAWLGLVHCTAVELVSLKERLDGWENGVTKTFMFVSGVVASVLIVWFDQHPTIADPLLFVGLSLSWLCLIRLIRPATEYNVLGFLLTAVAVRAVKLYAPKCWSGKVFWLKCWPMYLFFSYSCFTGVLRYFLESRDAAAVQVQG